MSAIEGPWNQLFNGPGPLTRVSAFAVHRRGQPFLLLPWSRGTAAAVLSLYPAQSPVARCAKTILSWLLAAPILWVSRRVSINIAPKSAFVDFLRSLAAVPASEVPTFGILAGNPASDGQRFLVILFDRSRRPVAVVKAGLTTRAQALVLQEESFLAAFDSETTALPKLRGSFQAPHLRAFGLDYIPGTSPSGRWDDPRLSKILSSWIKGTSQLPLGETPVWKRLQGALPMAGPQRADLAEVLRTLAPIQIPATLQHGDLAPWNIKVAADGNWTVLDWERGERNGIPAWDWFHYALQPAILVKRRSTAALSQILEALLTSPSFQSYSVRANIQGCQRELLLGYLAYMIQVIQPAEGLAAMQDLWRALQDRRQKG